MNFKVNCGLTEKNCNYPDAFRPFHSIMKSIRLYTALMINSHYTLLVVCMLAVLFSHVLKKERSNHTFQAVWFSRLLSAKSSNMGSSRKPFLYSDCKDTLSIIITGTTYANYV